MSKIAKSNGMMGFDSNVYSKLDSLFHDDEREFFIKCDDIYIKNAFKKYLEDNNFEYKDSNINNQFIFVSTVLGSFKFVGEANSTIEYNIPIDWEDVKMKIDDILKDNPIEKKEKVVKKPENWNLPAQQNGGGFQLVEVPLDQDTKDRMEKVYEKQRIEAEKRKKIVEENPLGDSEIKTQVLKSFNRPETFIICGGGDNNDLMVTDDYNSFDIRIGGKKVEKLNCDGFASILTIKEFTEWYNKMTGPEYRDDPFNWMDAVLAQNFTGDVEVGVTYEEDNTYTDNFDLSGFIHHQFEEDISVFINLPEGTKYEKIKDGNILALIRDKKIDTIIDSETEMGDDVR